MIQSKSSTVLYINKLSVLLVSLLLLLLWFNFNLATPNQQQQLTDINTNHFSDSKYLKKSIINPFLRTHDEASSNDILPTVILLQKATPAFASLDLKLHGIVFQHNQKGYAMISMQGAIQEIYRVDGEISEGLYVTNITNKQVEVDYFGKKYSLNIENSRLDQIAVTPPESVNEATTKLNFDQQALLDVDKKRNPIRLFMIRRPYAVYSNGEFQGYKIMPGSNTDQFERLGFHSGDIITYLNGIEFNGPGMKEFVIQQLTHALHINLTVLRGDQELSINYGF